CDDGHAAARPTVRGNRTGQADERSRRRSRRATGDDCLRVVDEIAVRITNRRRIDDDRERLRTEAEADRVRALDGEVERTGRGRSTADRAGRGEGHARRQRTRADGEAVSATAA